MSLFSKIKKSISNHRAHLADNPVFILGNEKSGTTVVASLLAKSTGLDVSLDISGLWDPIQSKVHSGQLSLEEVINENKVDFSRPIIKEPVLTFEFEKLLSIYPESKYVLVLRDPRDNIRSILNRLGLPGDIEDLGEKEKEALGPLWTTWNTVLYNEWLGFEPAPYIKSMALRWTFCADLLKQSDKIIPFRYEDFLQDKVVSIESLANSLNLESSNPIEDLVDHQYQSQGDNSKTWVDFYGLENYETIVSVCRAPMLSLGYEI